MMRLPVYMTCCHQLVNSKREELFSPSLNLPPVLNTEVGVE